MTHGGAERGRRKKEKVSICFSINSQLYKSIEGSRRGKADTLQRERGGREGGRGGGGKKGEEEKRKLRTQFKSSQTLKFLLKAALLLSHKNKK